MHMGILVTLISLATAFIIVAIPSWTNTPLAFLGALSYSFYLVHEPIGSRVINLALRLPRSPVVAAVSIGAGVAVSIGAAYVLYRFVERPSQRYAGGLRFDQEVPPSEGAGLLLTKAAVSMASRFVPRGPRTASPRACRKPRPRP
jgi:peptidoglycan/LPS O-acetylase OafA/YrhL